MIWSTLCKHSILIDKTIYLNEMTQFRDGQSAQIWSRLKFDPWSFDGTDRRLEILRWSISSDRFLNIREMVLYLGLAPTLLELL